MEQHLLLGKIILHLNTIITLSREFYWTSSVHDVLSEQQTPSTIDEYFVWLF